MTDTQKRGGKRPGAPKGRANGNYRNGCYTKEALAMSRYVNALARIAREAD